MITVVFAVWLFGTFMMFISTDDEAITFWDRFIYLGVVFMPALQYHFSLLVTHSNKTRKIMLKIAYTLSVVFLFLSRTDYFVYGVYHYEWGAHTIAQTLHNFFLAFFFFYIFALLYNFYRHFRDSEFRSEKYKMVYFTISFAILNLVGGMGYLPAYKISVYPISLIAPLVFSILITYAILRHHLMDIKVIITEILAVFMTVLFIAIISIPKNIVLEIPLILGFIVMVLILIRTASSEAKARDELKYLNEHLVQKVAEQTQEIKQAYEVEKKARVELEELDKAKDQFILTTQHHLRTPLTIVKGYLQSFLTKKSQSLDEEGKTYLTKAEEATDRIGTLVNEFLDISQMQVGKSIINKEPVNIKDLVVDAVKELESEVQKRNLKVTLNIENDTVLSIDPHKIREALTNVIDNAVKYNKEGGSISIKGIKINHPIERNKQIYRLIIEDTGIGLTSEELPKLFTQYFQRGKEAEKLYTTGRGIGLVVTKNIISAHNGRIYAESEGRGKGARFVVELPVY